MRALIITDRMLDEQRSPGFRLRVGSLENWLHQAGFDVEHRAISTDHQPSVGRRLVATVKASRRWKVAADDFDVIVVHAMNAPHMIWFARALRQHDAVVLDMCDSLTLWSKAVTWRGGPFFRLKNVIAKRLISSGCDGMICSYATFRDVQVEASLRPSQSSVAILNSKPSGLDALAPFVGPPTRIVIPADVSAVQNLEALKWFEDAVWSGELQLDLPVELYGPVAPTRRLPLGVVYKGWAPRLRDIYDGQTAVFAPTVRAAGIQNKYLEAVIAGRPVVVGRQPAESIPGYEGALPFASRAELVKQLDLLQHFATPLLGGNGDMAPDSEVQRAVSIVTAAARRRRKSM